MSDRLATEPDLRAVVTNVITGFLGVGKTTAIVHLLGQKPAHERWAVLVNEFGEIGVDGSLVVGQSEARDQLFVREVPGGCMCCAAGLPMQVALTQLLRTARPHRLLIEPTGLGHPAEVLASLRTESFRDVLDLQRTVTLVDARKLSEERYVTHPIFQEQLRIADLIVANKSDRYTPADRNALDAYVSAHCAPTVETRVCEFGKLPLSSLNGDAATPAPRGHVHSVTDSPVLASDIPFPDSGIVSAVNQGDGFASIGWRFSSRHVFERERLLVFLNGLDVERMKAAVITNVGHVGYNIAANELSETGLTGCSESRIEIVASCINADWEQGLHACLVGTPRVDA